MAQSHSGHESSHSGHGRPYLMFWLNMGLGLVVMYLVMFSMIDGWRDFRNNLNMAYMAVTMWAPMGVFMLATMPGMGAPTWVASAGSALARVTASLARLLFVTVVWRG